VEDIAVLDGVDVLFVGPRDLSQALDIPGQTQAPAYLAALDRVLAAAQAHGKAAGLLVSDGAAAARMTAAGWRFLAIGSDTTLLAGAVSAELRRATA
jgi:2-keto-3-deoxy-L-rhamnonate aldolase RhmA